MVLSRRIRRFGLIAVFIGLLLLTVGAWFPIWEGFQDETVTVQPDSHIAVATETRGGVYSYSFLSTGPVEFWVVNGENYALAESKEDFIYFDHEADAAKGYGEVQMSPGDVLYLVFENHGSVNLDAQLTLSWASQQTVMMTSLLKVLGVATAVMGIGYTALFGRKDRE